VPSAIRKDEKLAAKGLVSILVEAQGADDAKLEHFLWKTFPDNACFASVGVHVPIPPSDGIPHGAVIGVDGTLLWSGNPLDASKKIDELIDAELDKVKKGWGSSSEAKKVRAALYGKGDLDGAAAIVAAMAEGEERTALQTEVEKRYAVLKKAIPALQQQGRWQAALDAAKELLKAVASKPEWAEEVGKLVAEFDTDAAKAELAADKKMAAVEKQLRGKKIDAAIKGLQALVKASGQTKVGERAGRMLKALETPLDE
jgi:hypothetical protein